MLLANRDLLSSEVHHFLLSGILEYFIGEGVVCQDKVELLIQVVMHLQELVSIFQVEKTLCMVQAEQVFDTFVEITDAHEVLLF